MSDEKARIETLLGIMREYGLDALTLRVDGSTYELVRRDPAAPAPASAPAAVGSPAGAPHDEPPPNVRRMTAPLVGIFYRSPSPDAAPFIEVGDRVETGQVVCILEAMKMMNEITSDYAGIVTRILPQSGQLVTAGEDLLWIEP
ncbi:MAG TPA: biotin/lipoyl-containing protein [Candidatus Binatia bacterium]|nr:biotin/lipoyl-containing protein [Candidatus Binatia bacterium]